MERGRAGRGMANIRQIERGWDVYGADDEKVGDVSEVQDDYIVVSKGFLFTSERYIPASAITGIEHNRVYLSVTKDQIEAQGWDVAPERGGTVREERTRTTERPVEVDDDRTIQLREEELSARKEMVETGEVSVHKDVVEEEKTIDVPVSREEVYIERRPVESREADRFDVGEIGEGETIRVPVREEQVEVEKRAVVTEEIEVGKRAVQDTERFTDTVRREEVDIKHDDDVEVDQRGAGVPHSDEDPDHARRR